ncbi:conserved hypothetical protein [Verticillium alfalfae VaMs.102]|uniref:Uncharacterized protein n=1 Tax=Verticillium alfalfae (strain VaMs.102 / ATCC MYA-4576 / FGSC 10136) TaxID=526221 RepID=C9ST24_VERA1|nr:conserved hypothetical protein [Verticillium alfalfae VaMs.102]EEY21939.1 conserved hypothetical protein [Verticillium alfalfae VaMs.102]
MGPKLSIMVAAALVLVGNWVRYAGSHSSKGGTYGVVMFGQILTGLAQPFVLAAPTRYSDLWFSNRGRVGATALMSLANPFGAAIGQLVVPFMVEKPSQMSQGVLYVSIISSVCTLPAFFVPAAPPTPASASALTSKLPLMASLRTASRSLELWLLLIPFAFYVGFFNSCSSLLNQMLNPYGLSDDEAGIGGALLIVVGLVVAAITSPILDRAKACVQYIKDARASQGRPTSSSSSGAASFTLVPVAPRAPLRDEPPPSAPEVTSVIAWAGGQLLGGCFILISDALQAGPEADPPLHMKKALIFQAVIAVLIAPLPLCLGLFGRADKVSLRRVRSDTAALSSA